MRKALAISAIAVLGLALAGCESSQDKAARLKAEQAKRAKIASMPFSVPKVDPRIQVLGTTVLSGKDNNAVVVTVRNSSKTALAEVPVAFYVYGAGNRRIDSNTAPGSDIWLTHIPLLRPGQTVDWIHDQLDPKPGARKATVRVGPGKPVAKPYPDAVVVSRKFAVDPISGTEVTGKAAGKSPVLQERLVIYSVGRAGGRVVSAGRGVLEKLLPGSKGALGKPSGFSIFYTGADPKSTSLSFAGPPVLSPRK